MADNPTPPTTPTPAPGKTMSVTIGLPDGKSVDIGGLPEGTTKEQAWGYFIHAHPEYAQHQPAELPAPASSAPAVPSNWRGEVGLGALKFLGDVGVGAGQMMKNWGGVDLSPYVPGAVQRGYDALRQREEATPAGRAATLAGGIGASIVGGGAIPAIEGLSPIARAFTGAGIPGVLQPVDPNLTGEDFTAAKAEQLGGSTLLGLGLQGLGSQAQRVLKSRAGQAAIDAFQTNAQRLRDAIAGLSRQQAPLQRAADDAAARANEQIETQRLIRQAITNLANRKIAGEEARLQAPITQYVNRTNAQNEIAFRAQQLARQLAEGRRDIASDEARALAERQNRPIQEAAARQNQLATLAHRGQQAQHQLAQVSQADIPRQSTDMTYGLISRLARIGRPKEITPQSAVQMRDEVGAKLGPLYRQMTIDARGPRMVFPAYRDEVDRKLTGFTDPTVKTTWNDLYERIAFNPLNKAGLLEGQTLANYTSQMRDAINDLGLKAQDGDPAARIMANGLREMLHTVNQEAARFNPRLAQELDRVNMGYEMASRLFEASKGGMNMHPSPTDILEAWRASQGDALFAKDQRWADYKKQLFDMRTVHEEKLTGPGAAPPQITPPTVSPRPVPEPDVEAPTRPVPIKGPPPVQIRRMPEPSKVPPVRAPTIARTPPATISGRLTPPPRTPANPWADVVHVVTPHEISRAMRLMNAFRRLPPPVPRVTQHAGRLGPAAGVAAGRGVAAYEDENE